MNTTKHIGYRGFFMNGESTARESYDVVCMMLNQSTETCSVILPWGNVSNHFGWLAEVIKKIKPFKRSSLQQVSNILFKCGDIM